MKTLSRNLFAAALAATLSLGALSALAQDANNNQGGNRRNRGQGGPGGGNFDPAQFRQRMMERVREEFGVKDDDEWKIISERIEKVDAARREIGGRGMGMFGRGRGGPGGPGGAGGQGGGRGGFGGEPSPEATALQSAIENNASADDIKAKLAAYRESQKAKEAKLAKAQDELRQVLTGKQEAAAVLAGYLK
jgi:hypothetical protein